jgi:hypothetical protein
VLVAIGYILCIVVGNAFVLESNVSVIWPPSGFVLAVLLRLGMRAIVPLWIGAAVFYFISLPASPLVAVLLSDLGDLSRP